MVWRADTHRCPAKLTAARLRSRGRVGEDEHSAVEPLRGHKPELLLPARLAEESLAFAEHDGKHVERRPNPRDRRSRPVFLTARGVSVRPVTHGTAARVEERWAELTSPEELKALRASLLRLLTELRAD